MKSYAIPDLLKSQFSGWRIIPNPLLEKEVRKETRVQGGYLNRWWIRKITYEMEPQILVQDYSGTIFVHPSIYEELKRLYQLPRKT